MRKQKKVTIFDPALTHITALSCTKVLSSLWSVLCDSATPNCWLTENSGPLCEQRCSIMCHVEYLHMHKDMHTHTRMIHRPTHTPAPTHPHTRRYTHTTHICTQTYTHNPDKSIPRGPCHRGCQILSWGQQGSPWSARNQWKEKLLSWSIYGLPSYNELLWNPVPSDLGDLLD